MKKYLLDIDIYIMVGQTQMFSSSILLEDCLILSTKTCCSIEVTGEVWQFSFLWAQGQDHPYSEGTLGFNFSYWVLPSFYYSYPFFKIFKTLLVKLLSIHYQEPNQLPNSHFVFHKGLESGGALLSLSQDLQSPLDCGHELLLLILVLLLMLWVTGLQFKLELLGCTESQNF